MLMAQAMCTWHHDHRGGPTPCGQAKMEAAAVVGYLATHKHRVVPDDNVRWTIDGDDIKVWANDMLIFEGKRSHLTWEHPDRDVRDVMRQLWESGQDEGVQEYVINGVPAHMATYMTLDELKTPPGLRKNAWKREREGYWNDVAEMRRQDKRLHEILRDAIPPHIGTPITTPGHLTAETIRRGMEEMQRYPMTRVLPDHYQMHVVPPSPRAWAEQHIANHSDHIVLIAGPADTQTQCFYPSDCKATMWEDPDYPDKFQRAVAGFKWEVEHNIYRQGVESSDDPGE